MLEVERTVSVGNLQMGADLWHHEATWTDDPNIALLALQADFVTQNYDLKTRLPQELEWARVGHGLQGRR